MNHIDTMLALLNGKKIKKGQGYVMLSKEGYIVDQNGQRAPFSLGRDGRADCELYPDELITKDEKKLLSLVMKDFGKKDFIRKVEFIQLNGTYQQIQLVNYIQGVEMVSALPRFVKGTKFRGLELKRGYHKEDLGL